MSRLEPDALQQMEGAYADRYRSAMESIALKERRKEASGYAWMAAAAGYQSAAFGPSRFGRVARGAKWFVIWTAMIVPNLLFIHVLF